MSEKGVQSFLFQIFCSVDRLLLEVMEKREHVKVIFKDIHNICIFLQMIEKEREEKGRTFVTPDKDRVLRAQRARLFPRQDF